MATTFEQAAHGQAARLPIAAIARYLEDVLGQRLTAVVAGTSDAKAVSKWANGTRSPHPETERNLRHAFHVAQLLMQVEAAETVRTWFAGMNPDLDDLAPALLIATDPGRVVQAARVFLANG